MAHRVGMASGKVRGLAKNVTAEQLFQQKTDGLEQVFRVMSEEKRIERETIGSSRKGFNFSLIAFVLNHNPRVTC